MTTHNRRITLRAATRDDIPALLSLILTSFRRFSLFDYLYRPLHENQDYARDTLYIWNGQFLKTLWDQSARIIVAEVDGLELPATPSSDTLDSVDIDSWEMINWLANANLGRRAGGNKNVVGFAIWRYENIPCPVMPITLLEKWRS